jgi:hypothetical protein
MHRNIIVAGAIALGFGLAPAVYAADQLSDDTVKAERTRIEAEYKADKARCDGLTGNAKDVCQSEAKAKERIAKAELEARAKGTPKAEYEARVARAEAEYDVAKEKCDDLAGNDKDLCVKNAKAAEKRAKADAKAQYKG